MRHKESRSAQANLDWGLWEMGKEPAQLPRRSLCIGNFILGRGEPETPQSVALAVVGQTQCALRRRQRLGVAQTESVASPLA